jgi:hypothetical protein
LLHGVHRRANHPVTDHDDTIGRLGQLMLKPPASGFIDYTNGGTISPANNPLNPGFGDVKD